MLSVDGLRDLIVRGLWRNICYLGGRGVGMIDGMDEASKDDR